MRIDSSKRTFADSDGERAWWRCHVHDARFPSESADGKFVDVERTDSAASCGARLNEISNDQGRMTKL